MNNRPSPNNSNKRFFYRYASLGTQLLVALGLAVFIGLKTDRWLHSLPLFSCLLPLLVLGLTFYKMIRETSGRRSLDEGDAGNKKNNESK
jgi:F0F1-type ATP synthase assembly protein I